MEPQIVAKPQMMLLGLSFFGDPFSLSAGWTEENEIGRLWKRFMAYLAERGQQIRHVVSNAVTYKVHIYHEETPQTGEFEVFVGMEVARLEGMPRAVGQDPTSRHLRRVQSGGRTDCLRLASADHQPMAAGGWLRGRP
jgi:predicted transcriptional regulator YdeE